MKKVLHHNSRGFRSFGINELCRRWIQYSSWLAYWLESALPRLEKKAFESKIATAVCHTRLGTWCPTSRLSVNIERPHASIEHHPKTLYRESLQGVYIRPQRISTALNVSLDSAKFAFVSRYQMNQRSQSTDPLRISRQKLPALVSKSWRFNGPNGLDLLKSWSPLKVISMYQVRVVYCRMARSTSESLMERLGFWKADIGLSTPFTRQIVSEQKRKWYLYCKLD